MINPATITSPLAGADRLYQHVAVQNVVFLWTARRQERGTYCATGTRYYNQTEEQDASIRSEGD